MTGHLGSTRPRRSNLAFGQATPASLPHDSSRDSRLGRPRGSSVLLSLIEVPIHRCHNYATSHAFHCSAAARNNSVGVRTSVPDEAVYEYLDPRDLPALGGWTGTTRLLSIIPQGDFILFLGNVSLGFKAPRCDTT